MREMNKVTKYLWSFLQNNQAQAAANQYSSSYSFEHQSYGNNNEDKVSFPLSQMSRAMMELKEQGSDQNGIGNTTTVTGGTDTDMVVPFTMDELEALYSHTRNIETRTNGIIRMISATISIIASFTLIWMIS